MRQDLLKASEKEFFTLYPGGFDHPEMQEITKKHKPQKMHETALSMFEQSKLTFVDETIENMIKIISRSSMVSVFEKPKFRDFARSLNDDQKETMVNALEQLLHGDKEKGFNTLVEILSDGKLAKWSLISVIPYYYYPQEEVFMKPTTVKGIVKTFELEGLHYKPRPSYAFYCAFKEQLMEMKEQVDERLCPNNAAFSGFLMMMMEK